MRNDIITISRGPQFKQGKSASLFVLLLIFIIIDGILIVYFQYIAAFALILIPIPLIINILDIQGVQIDKGNRLIRNYKLRIWGKSGEWSVLSNFHSVYLDYKTYHIKSSSIFTELTTVKANYHATELYGHFLILLIHKNENKSLILGEKVKYNDAKQLAEEYSKKIGLPFRNIIKERVQESRKKRANKRR